MMDSLGTKPGSLVIVAHARSFAGICQNAVATFIDDIVVGAHQGLRARLLASLGRGPYRVISL
jgi:hypothetical protein